MIKVNRVGEPISKGRHIVRHLLHGLNLSGVRAKITRGTVCSIILTNLCLTINIVVYRPEKHFPSKYFSNHVVCSVPLSVVCLELQLAMLDS